MDQHKMQNLLRLLMLLAGNKRYSIAEISELFSMSERSAYRYLDTLEHAGFIVERTHSRYRLEQDNTSSHTLGRLLHFNEEEVCILFKTLEIIEPASPVAERLIHKLNTLYGIKALAGQYKDAEKLEAIRLLTLAMEGKQQALLHDYRSSNSGQIASRLVEPFSISADYHTVLCYDTESKASKQFKISRIRRVELTGTAWQYSQQHQQPYTDAFRMNSDGVLVTVEAIITLKAYNLLIEEFPLAAPYIITVQAGGRYQLKIPVAQFEGIGRFVLGLAGEISEVKPTSFLHFLKEKIKLAADTGWQ